MQTKGAICCCFRRIYKPVPSNTDWRNQLSEEEKNVYLTEKTLLLVSENLGEGWEAVGVRLGLTYVCVQRCKMTHSTCVLQIFAMLNTRRRKEGQEATAGNLMVILQQSLQVCNTDMWDVVAVLKEH
ncbi:uncharacterized protein LOC124260715 [Haliotis rubra]|uniref:uncharacterized protein LOC124260715 n=1 Tax=Haliotis rubra TaxID=36100 RepID=UPI001EE52749|nr:uncharacterized protein LOC124260715 [Haliotis rubra]